jgi:hypothetical protein
MKFKKLVEKKKFLRKVYIMIYYGQIHRKVRDINQVLEDVQFSLVWM